MFIIAEKLCDTVVNFGAKKLLPVSKKQHRDLLQDAT